ncbi:MAG TPA: ATP-binding protein [Streptosporangiaceae bacterium]|nr:ATP-binding protein [Streptosporangiaceae bacterium]
MFRRPADMFDRDEEWAALSRFAADGTVGATLGVVSGRRRQGKTFLLDALCKASDGFFFEATEATEAESLRRIGALLGDYTGAPFPPRPANWHEVLDALLRLGEDRPVTAVIDEFPYLVRANPSLPSVVQAALGPRREERTRSQTRLLLCGSAMSFMGRLLSGAAPLRGRAALEMVVPTLDFRQAAQFWSVRDHRLAVLLYSVVGGTPAYRDGVAGGQAPKSLTDFDRWVPDNVLSRFSPLFREARYLLAEEPDIRDNAVYHAVLSAVAEGNATRGGIAGYLERKATDISHHLSVLEDAGFLIRDVDVFRPGRSIYGICEPLVVFYHAIMRPEWSRLERRGQAAQVWQDSTRRFAGSVVGPRFEQICRDWVQDYAPEDVAGGVVAQVGQGMVNDPERKTAHQIDVVVFGNDDSGQRTLLAIGEAKWAEPLGAGHLARLQRVRELLTRNGQPGAWTARLLCFGSVSPSEQLRRAAAAGDVRLVGLDDLYGER